MSEILLSQNANKTLNIIYKECLSNKNDNFSNAPHYKAFFINSIFDNSNDTDLMSSLIELSKNKMIRFFSDKRIMLSDRAISYIERN